MRDDLLFQVLDKAPTTVEVFDYLKSPLERSSVQALLRMYDLIPILAHNILNEMMDRLDNAGLIVQTLKKDWPKISNLLQENSRRVLKRYKEDETQHNCATVVGEYHLQMRIIDDLSRKVLPYISKDTRKLWQDKPGFYDVMSRGRIQKFVKKYMALLALYENLMSTENLITYKKEVIDRCIPMGQLEVGQTFIFPYAEHAMDDGGQEFTYAGLAEEDVPGDSKSKNIVCLYRKINDSIFITYKEQNALRAVIPTVQI